MHESGNVCPFLTPMYNQNQVFQCPRLLLKSALNHQPFRCTVQPSCGREHNPDAIFPLKRQTCSLWKNFVRANITQSLEIAESIYLTLFLVTSSDFYTTFSTAVLAARLPPRGLHHIKSGNVSPSIVITNSLEAKLLDLCWILTCLSFFLYLFTSLSREDRHTLSYQFCFPSFSVGHSLHLICLKLWQHLEEQ